jgi:hypothetical protein
VQVCEKDIMMIKQLGAGACATVGVHCPGHTALAGHEQLGLGYSASTSQVPPHQRTAAASSSVIIPAAHMDHSAHARMFAQQFAASTAVGQ